MDRIPKKFQIGPYTVRVHIVTKKQMEAVVRKNGDWDRDEYCPQGYTVFEASEIYILKAYKDFKGEFRMHVFWHEYFHMLLDKTGRVRMARDEVLVDALAAGQMQAINSFKY